jgi:uncharacterized protein YjbI with pentapeptide repeats
MANEEQLAVLKQGVEVWNKWRQENSAADLDLTEADLTRAELSGADLSNASLRDARLRGADLTYANLREASLWGADLSGASLIRANLTSTFLRGADLQDARLMDASLIEADLTKANLARADLTDADLEKSRLIQARLSKANLTGASLVDAVMTAARLPDANLTGADLWGAWLLQADFRRAILAGANLRSANLWEADLTEADLSGADLTNSNMVRTRIHNARISKSRVYAVNVWDLQGEFAEQKELVITPGDASAITVDNIKVAQFIYLILNNQEIREVLNTLTSKTVLILGRFVLQERKEILDALREKLREYDLLPIVFDFDRPVDKDFTETIKTLAGLCYFVIADVTNPRSSPLELQASIPDYQIPFVPVIQEGEQPFAMMVDLQKKYNWVLDTLSYRSKDELIRALKPAIIDPAIQKHNELRLIKAREPKIRSASDIIEDKGLE